MSRQTRTVITVAACVLALHGAALWALQLGLMARNPAAVVPVQLLARIVEPPRPTETATPLLETASPPPAVAAEPTVPKADRPVPKPALTVRKPALPVPIPSEPTKPMPAAAATKMPTTPMPQPTVPAPVPAPMPAAAETDPARAPVPPAALAEPATTPVESTVTAVPEAGTPAANRRSPDPVPASGTTLAAAHAPLPVVPVVPVQPMPPVIELPSSAARYLQNPQPRYPPISRRLREQGTVLVEVLVSEKGLAEEARVQTSSGFFRLDHAAVSTVSTWRFVPGKRDGIAESMWFIVPIEFISR